MKILLRKDFKWYECTFDFKRGSIITTDNNIIPENDIVAIQDDERSKYVKCIHCGEILRNTKKAIAEHCSKKCDEKACLTCSYKRAKVVNAGEYKYVPLPDGTYKEKYESTVSLYCNLRYSSIDIKSEQARTGCKYRNCAEAKENYTQLDGFFIKHPNAFDDLPTVDALDEKVWTFDSRYNNKFIFKAKKRFTLYANANEKGIITDFIYKKRYSSYSFVYSKKYNQIFWMNGSSYSTSKPYELTSTQFDELKKVIENIYNYEVTK